MNSRNETKGKNQKANTNSWSCILENLIDTDTAQENRLNHMRDTIIVGGNWKDKHFEQENQLTTTKSKNSQTK